MHAKKHELIFILNKYLPMLKHINLFSIEFDCWFDDESLFEG